ncbi:MAG: NUDIX hydrolase [Thermoplasmata archaeon]
MGRLERPSDEEVDRILRKYGRIRRRVVDWNWPDRDEPEEPPCDGEVVPLVRDEEGRLAVVRHRAGTGDFVLPTGRIQPGEGIEAAAVREALDETGFHVAIDEVPALHRVRIRYRDAEWERWFFLVLCRVLRAEDGPKDTEEIEAVKFVQLPGEMPIEWVQAEWPMWVLKDASLLHPHAFLVGKASSD